MIFGCVNAHFSHNDLSHSIQYVYGGLLAKQQNVEVESLTGKRPIDGVELAVESIDEKAECWRCSIDCDGKWWWLAVELEANNGEKSLLWMLLAGLSRSPMLLWLFPLNYHILLNNKREIVCVFAIRDAIGATIDINY